MPDQFAKEFGLRVRGLRLERGLSQEVLANDTGLHRTHISLIERAERSVRLETIKLLAQGLGVQPAVLMPEIRLGKKTSRTRRQRH